MRTRRLLGLVAVILAIAAAPAVGTGGPAAVRTATDEVGPADDVATVAVVQAVPGVEMAVSVDGEPVGTGVSEGEVVPMVRLSPGDHDVQFSFADGRVAASVDVAAGTRNDVVVHLPASVDGDPVVSVYPVSTEPIGPGKARVVLAHTATTAPADVSVDGKLVFTNIANGEYAEADVPAGRHRVALLPSGIDGPPILGPLDVVLTARTTTSIYAVGNPRLRSMDVILRRTPLRDDGSEPPRRVDTGSAGLVADWRLPGLG
ncbi:DUF4397 domain-containing protein [Nocardioides marinquilinus]